MHNDLTAETERCCTEINDMPARRRWSPDAKALFWCFAAPFFAMILIYCCLMVWPAGKNSVLVLDLNAQYIYYFEQLREEIGRELDSAVQLNRMAVEAAEEATEENK